jgi:hypothetical protein
MIYLLIERDPAWRLAPKVAIFNALLLAAISHTIFARVPAVFLLSAVAGLGAFIRPDQRCGMFEATLPLRAKDLFAARVLSLMALFWLPLLAGAFALIAAGVEEPARTCLYLLEVGVVLTLVTLIVQCTGSQTFASSKYLWVALMLIATVAGALLMPLHIMQRIVSLRTVIVWCVALSLALFVKTWLTLPESFQITGTALTRGAPRIRSGIAFSWAPIVRSLLTRNTVVLYLLAPVLAVAQSPMFALVFLTTLPLHVYTSLRWLLALPVSRQKLLLLILLPVAAILIVSTAISSAMPLFRYRQPLSDTPCPSPTNYLDVHKCLNVSPTYWTWSIGNSQPYIRAPWGEMCAAEKQTFLGITASNPWTVRGDSSFQFFDWQLHRASLAIFGGPPPREVFFHSARLVRPLVRRPRLLVAGAGVTLAWYMALLFLTNLPGWVRMPGRPNVARWIGRVLSIPLLLAWLFPTLWMKQHTDYNVALDAVLFRLSPFLPQSTAAVTALTLAVLLVLYWLLENHFEEVEILTRTPTPM